MADQETEKDWHTTQNAAYLDLLESRLREPRLLWVDQFIDIINRELNNGALRGKSLLSVNDYGCNVGHFYRGVENIACAVDYRGFDISDTYLSIARQHFHHGDFHHLDIEQDLKSNFVPQCDVAVISATLEHIDNYVQALSNILSRTNDLVIIRTFVGDMPLEDRCRTIGAQSDFLVRQFSVAQLTKIPVESGWKFTQEIDRATQGKTKMVCNGDSMPRAQGVFVLTRS